MKNFEYISFDAADTVIHLVKSVGEQYASVAGKHGVIVDPVELNMNFLKVFHAKPPLDSQGNKGFDWWFEVIRDTFRQTDVPEHSFADFPSFAMELYKLLSANKTWAFYPDVFPVLKELKARGKKIILFSNFDERLKTVIADLDATEYFEEIVCSSELGYAKPSKEAFKAVESLLNISAGQIVHIGDSYTNDYLGAVNAGWGAYLLQRNNQQNENDYEISSLTQLLEKSA
jgi:putative hydrolase of the HAD superfamily